MIWQSFCDFLSFLFEKYFTLFKVIYNEDFPFVKNYCYEKIILQNANILCYELQINSTTN